MSHCTRSRLIPRGSRQWVSGRPPPASQCNNVTQESWAKLISSGISCWLVRSKRSKGHSSVTSFWTTSLSTKLALSRCTTHCIWVSSREWTRTCRRTDTVLRAKDCTRTSMTSHYSLAWRSTSPYNNSEHLTDITSATGRARSMFILPIIIQGRRRQANN